MLMEEPWDLIINVGHVVPHEVLGFANHNKNYFIGLGGKDTICAAHMMAATCGIENNLGNLVTPARACFNKAEDDFLGHLPDLYVQVVLARNDARRAGPHRRATSATTWRRIWRPPGSRASRTSRCSTSRCEKIVCVMQGDEFVSTWVANKADLSHADGPGRRRRAGHHRPGPEAVRRAARGRRVHSQVRLLRHAAR